MLTDDEYWRIVGRSVAEDMPSRAQLDEAYRLGVAAERKRCAEVCKSFVMGRVDSYDSHDEAWWSCINEIERGEDA